MGENSTLFYHVHLYGDQGKCQLEDINTPFQIPEEIETVLNVYKKDVGQHVIENILQFARTLV